MNLPENTLGLDLPEAEAIARNLSEAIRLPTIAGDDASPREPFLQMHRLLERQYPQAHRVLKREAVNDLSLLYTWESREPEQPGVAFLAHQDVVPAGEEAVWTHPPFAGAIEAGYVWGRGAIDMKCQLIALMEAAEALAGAGYRPRRTIYLAFGHDEEVGGNQGARRIAQALRERGAWLEALMDEGGGVSGGVAPGMPGLIATVATAEKAFANVTLEVKARAGHASMPGRSGAIGILSEAIRRIERRPMPATLEYVRPAIRALRPRLPWPLRVFFGNLWLTGGLVKAALAQEPITNAMLRSTVAVTVIRGGYKANVLPESATATLNCRLLPGVEVEELLAHLRRAVDDERVSIRCVDTSAPAKAPASLESPFYRSLETAIGEFYGAIPTCPTLMTGASDARHYEAVCARLYRFQPVRFARPEDDRTHGVDERVEVAQLPEMVGFNTRMMQAWGEMDRRITKRTVSAGT